MSVPKALPTSANNSIKPYPEHHLLADIEDARSQDTVDDYFFNTQSL